MRDLPEAVKKFFKKKRLLELIKETEELLLDLDVTYKEVKGWRKGTENTTV